MMNTFVSNAPRDRARRIAAFFGGDSSASDTLPREDDETGVEATPPLPAPVSALTRPRRVRIDEFLGGEQSAPVADETHVQEATRPRRVRIQEFLDGSAKPTRSARIQKFLESTKPQTAEVTSRLVDDFEPLPEGSHVVDESRPAIAMPFIPVRLAPESAETDWRRLPPSAIARQLLFQEGKREGMPWEFIRQFADREETAGNLRLYDIGSGRDLTTDELLRSSAYDPQSNSLTLHGELPFLQRMKQEYESAEYAPTVERSVGRAIQGEIQPGEAAYNILAPPVRKITQGVELASRPLRAASTLINATDQAKLQAARRLAGDSSAHPIDTLTNAPSAAWEELAAGKARPGYENALTTVTHELADPALAKINPHLPGMAKMVTDIVGDPLTLIAGAGALSKAGKFARAGEAAMEVAPVESRLARVVGETRLGRGFESEASAFREANKAAVGRLSEQATAYKGRSGPLPVEFKAEAYQQQAAQSENLMRVAAEVEKKTGVRPQVSVLPDGETVRVSVDSPEVGRFSVDVRPDSAPRVSVPELSVPAETPNDLDTVRRAIEKTAGTRIKPKRDTVLTTAVQLYRVGLLGAKTHIRNVTSTGSMQALEEVARLPSSIIDMGVSAVTGVRSVSGPNLRAVARSSYQAATKGVKEAAEIMKHGATRNELQSLELPGELNSGSRVIDAYVNTVFRSLSAEDRVYRTYAARRSLEDQARVWAINEARNAKIPRSQIPSRTRELVADPPASFEAQAALDAEAATFNDPNLVHSIYSSGRKRLDKSKVGRVANASLDVLFPYTRTPLNITKRVLEYTPLGSGAASARAARAIVRRSFTEAEQRAFSRTFGRSATGSGLITLGYALAKNGLLTGSHQDYKDFERGRTTGRPEMSIRDPLTNTWHSIGGIAPVGNLLATGATIYEANRDRELGASEDGHVRSALAAGADILTEQPLASTPKDLAAALSEPEKKGAKFAGRLAGGVVPTVVSDIGAATDEYARERGNTFAGQIKIRMPGLRQSLPAQRDALGEVVEHRRSSAVDPTLTTSDKTADPVRGEIARLRLDVGRAYPTGGESNTNFDRRVAREGRLLKQILSEAMESKDYQAFASDRSRRAALQRIVNFTRAAIRKGRSDHAILEDSDVWIKFLDKTRQPR